MYPDWLGSGLQHPSSKPEGMDLSGSEDPILKRHGKKGMCDEKVVEGLRK